MVRKNRIIRVVVPVIAVLGAGALLGRYASLFGSNRLPPTGRTPLQAADTVAGSFLDGLETGLSAEPIGPAPMSHWVNIAAVVAEVQVEEVYGLRFNTPGGAVPTQDPATIANPDAELSETDGLFLFRPIVLSPSTVYKTDDPTVTGYVVIQMGGSLPGSNGGYTYDPTPRLVFDESPMAVVFLSDAPPGFDAPYFLAATDVAADLSSNGGNYRAMMIDNVYHYDGSDATSPFERRTYAIPQLIAEILAALGAPTPTP